MKYDNPAARLLLILERGKSFPAKRNCRESWEELLAAPADSALLMARLGRLMALPQLVVRNVAEAYPTQQNTWTHWEGQVSAAFMVQNMHGEWATFINNIDGHSLNYLRLAADLLNASSKARLLETDELSDAKSKVQAALDAVLAAGIPPALKSQLVRCLRKVLEALDEYRITGGLGIIESTDAALGHSSVDSEYRTFLRDTEIGQRALDAISAAANLLTVSVGIPQLTVVLTQVLAQ